METQTRRRGVSKGTAQGDRAAWSVGSDRLGDAQIPHLIGPAGVTDCSGVMVAHLVGNGFPRSETFEQPAFSRRETCLHNRHPAQGDLCTTVILAQGDLCTTVIPRICTTVIPRRETFAQPSFSRRETLEQPSFPQTTVIPAQSIHALKAGIQDWGFPARNTSDLRHAVSHRGRYAQVSVRGNDGGGGLGDVLVLDSLNRGRI